MENIHQNLDSTVSKDFSPSLPVEGEEDMKCGTCIRFKGTVIFGGGRGLDEKNNRPIMIGSLYG